MYPSRIRDLIQQNAFMELPDYPGYAINRDGEVLTLETGLMKRRSLNQQGILMVNFSINAKQHVRAVAPLVAHYFLSREDIPDHFDTPIHLNGDRTDCRVDNLAWRPRWFAVKYHRQFLPEERFKNFGFQSPVELINTGEVFPTSWEAAIKYGLLDKEIFIATINRTYVFPHSFFFREIDT